MTDSFVLKMVDLLIKPQQCYCYRDIRIEGYRLITTKEEQNEAGALYPVAHHQRKIRSFGHNPLQPYRDYYGQFILHTTLVPDELIVRFAIGYTILSKVVTADDMSKFSWLRLSTGLISKLYPNLADQKQLLDYLLKHSSKPAFYVTRVYHFLQMDIYHDVSELILDQIQNG